MRGGGVGGGSFPKKCFILKFTIKRNKKLHWWLHWCFFTFFFFPEHFHRSGWSRGELKPVTVRGTIQISLKIIACKSERKRPFPRPPAYVSPDYTWGVENRTVFWRLPTLVFPLKLGRIWTDLITVGGSVIWFQWKRLMLLLVVLVVQFDTYTHNYLKAQLKMRHLKRDLKPVH